jgi:hypothetical protein
VTTRVKKQNNPLNEPVLVKKRVMPDMSKSLCKDRHFEIVEDKYGNIAIMGSTVE